jgi:hypothetical protein
VPALRAANHPLAQHILGQHVDSQPAQGIPAHPVRRPVHERGDTEMKVKVYKDRCVAGHKQRRPFSRNLAFVWGTKTLRLSVHYDKLSTVYVCGACYL